VPPVDFRLQPCLFQHPKWLRLLRELGPEAGISLLKLWGFAAESRPTGALEGLAGPDIAIAAGWTGDSNKFVETLVRLRWLDRRAADTYSIHDWPEHQPWLIGAPARAEHARRMSKARWRRLALPPEPAQESRTRKPPRKLKHVYSPEFEQAWAAYPPKAEGHSKPDAYKAWQARLNDKEDSTTPADLIAGTQRYAAWVRTTGTTLIKNASTFFGPGLHFKLPWASEANGGHASNGHRTPRPIKLPTLDDLDAHNDRATVAGKQE
jgi:hypothetical protein